MNDADEGQVRIQLGGLAAFREMRLPVCLAERNSLQLDRLLPGC